MGITDIIIDIADIVTDIAGIADRVLQTLRWKQVGVYKVSRGYPVTFSIFLTIKAFSTITVTYLSSCYW